MPIVANAAFDNTGNIYDPTVIVFDGVFNQTAYENYSPVFLPTAYALAYGIGFAALSALVTHTWRKLLLFLSGGHLLNTIL
jgi:hypothetical protein